MFCYRLFMVPWLPFTFFCKAKYLKIGRAVHVEVVQGGGDKSPHKATKIINLLWCLVGLGSSIS